MKNVKKVDENTIECDGRVFKAEKVEPESWKPKIGDRYWLVQRAGGLESYVWADDETDRRLSGEVGNCFKTEDEAKASIFYFAQQSDYYYWIPGMKRPKERIAGCECWRGGWFGNSQCDPKYWELLHRWPKGGQK